MIATYMLDLIDYIRGGADTPEARAAVCHLAQAIYIHRKANTK